MKWTSLNDLREMYLSFFESKGHLRLGSFSLVPENDKSLLLINAGMAPLKKFFTGEEEPPRHRVTTCQKCVRTLDIDNVGKTARHGTYFEMLGNFSFGDYFKKEALTWAWEFITKVLEMPEDRLWATIYTDDDEAYSIWTKDIGMPTNRIVRLGKADNFWEHGSGPCGPCSEIYFDRGEEFGCHSPDCKPGCDCDRYMEFWNNVFTQFNNDGAGNYTELSQKNIDTGMGLERLACIMQGVDNLFEVDTVRRILDNVCSIAGIKYGDDAKADVSVRVITDHIRSSTFLISDGVLPSNEGRGYILRRLLRRAARHGKLLEIKDSFLSSLCETVIAENVSAYPELEKKRDFIKKVISIEEERFDQTIDSGLSILSQRISAVKSEGGSTLSGEDAFKLYDTFGFPLDITKDVAAEAGLGVDEDGFDSLMKSQKERARAARNGAGGWDNATGSVLSGMAKTSFVGYDSLTADTKVKALICDGELADAVSEGEFGIILEPSPFYAESGGQVGDTGIVSGDGFTLEITDTKKSDEVFVSTAKIVSGMVKVGDSAKASVDAARRADIKRNHTGAHLLQSALRRILGDHVEQAGSYVDAHRLRFDFSHFQALTAEEIAQIEKLVNEHILLAEEVTSVETDIESAKAAGAMALFGEKYGKTVRMVRAGDFSLELCGGTHCSNTGEIGLMKIISESSVAAGVRRIEAVTGYGVLGCIAERDALISDCASALKAQNASVLVARAHAVTAELSAAKKEIDALNAKLAGGKLDEIIGSAENLGGVRFACADLGETSIDSVRSLGDKIKEQYPDTAAIFAVRFGGKLNLLAFCGKAAVSSGAHAGNIVKAAAAVCGGRGGGRPDSAQAGASDSSKLTEAFEEAKNILTEAVK